MEIEKLYTHINLCFYLFLTDCLEALSEAEDMVHEIFTDIQAVETENIGNIKAYLCKMITNRSIDYLKSAKKNREVYTGPWLPEPLNTEDKNDPLLSMLQQDRITYALLSLMEQLNPVERAIFVSKGSIRIQI